MSRDMFDCLVSVYAEGYEWIETNTPSDLPRFDFQHGFKRTQIDGSDKRIEPLWYLTDRQPNYGPIIGEHVTYNPINVSGLFRDFTEIEPTKEAIKRFADVYGSLGHPLGESIRLTNEAGKVVECHGELLDEWIWHINEMGRVVELWDLVQRRNHEELARYIKWHRTERGTEVLYDSHPDLSNIEDAPSISQRQKILVSESVNPYLLETCMPGDLIVPALFEVMRTVNMHLFRESSVRMRWNEKVGSNLHLVVQTQGLHNALWLQFALAIDGGRDYRKCKACGSWFELHPDLHRSNSLFCGNACRQKAYRQRQTEARRLQVEGMQLEEIAKRLETDVETVRGWLSHIDAPTPARKTTSKHKKQRRS